MAFYAQPCDSGYFVESHDDREWQFREQMRDRERVAKMETQQVIGNHLSYLASLEYGDDHLRHMEIMEVKRLTVQISLIFNADTSA